MDIILDTDLGNDCDDAMALAYMLYAQRELDVNIKAVTLSHPSWRYGIPAIISIFKYFKTELVPMGIMEGYENGTDDTYNYCKDVVRRFYDGSCTEKPENAVKVLRKALCDSENAVLCAIGPLTNIAALLESKGDEISEKSGIELLKAHCSQVVLMAGNFEKNENGTGSAEWNVKQDVCAAQKVMKLLPVKTVLLPYNVGEDMMSGKSLMDKYAENNPISLAFLSFRWIDTKKGRHSWDPATLVYAVEGIKSFFEESESGTVSVDDGGVTEFKPCESGLHKYLTLNTKQYENTAKCKSECGKYIDRCAEKLCENV